MSRLRFSTLALTWLAATGLGCALQIEKTLVMQEGSGLDLYFISFDEPPVEVFVDHIGLSGGIVMVIDVSLTVTDYLDGSADGDVAVTDLLFVGDDVAFFQLPLGPMCIGLGGPSGGTFEYEVLTETARFDVVVDTAATLLDPTLAFLLGGVIGLPFDLESEIQMSQTEAIALFTGTGDLEVTQPVDLFAMVSQFQAHVLGEVTLKTEDAFPDAPVIQDCLAVFSSTGT